METPVRTALSSSLGRQLVEFIFPAQMPAHAAHVEEPVTRRVMDVLTTEPGLQLYTANHFGDNPGPRQSRYPAKSRSTVHRFSVQNFGGMPRRSKYDCDAYRRSSITHSLR